LKKLHYEIFDGQANCGARKVQLTDIRSDVNCKNCRAFLERESKEDRGFVADRKRIGTKMIAV